MRGEVEIWDGDKLLYKQPNMLVDGAGELLADIMTVSPSLSGIEDHATSSILDSSNYTIQAISFGTGSQAFTSERNAQNLQPKKKTGIVNLFLKSSTLGEEQGPNVWAAQESALGGSYIPEAGLPEAPNPTSKVLEHNTSIPASLTISGVDYSISSVFPGNGQHVNFLPSAIGSSMMENTIFSGVVSDETIYYPSALSLVAGCLGAFPAGSSVNQTAMTRATQLLLVKLPEEEDGDYELADLVTSVPNTYGFFNEVSSMDVSGFVNMVMSGSPGTTTNYSMSSGASGLCVSGGHDPDNSGIVEYSLMLSKGDMATVNMYGGIYHLGLWTIDMKQSLLNGNTPPFAFSVLNNPRKYKLFCRKGLSKNLCFIQDHLTNKGIENYKDLLLKWRLHFV